MNNEVYETLISKVKDKEPSFYQFLMTELDPYRSHHYYHTKILDCFRGAIASGFLSEAYSDIIPLIEKEHRNFVRGELIGTWVGTESESVEFTLQLNSPSDFLVYRSWSEEIDGQLCEEFQEFKSLDSEMVECDGLIILNLFTCEKRRSRIKLALLPAIAYHKNLVGSQFWFQDETYSGCTRVILEKVENGT